MSRKKDIEEVIDLFGSGRMAVTDVFQLAYDLGRLAQARDEWLRGCTQTRTAYLDRLISRLEKLVGRN